MKTNLIVCGTTVLLLSACNLVEVTEEPVVEEPVVEQEVVRETENVTYTGVVQPAGISIYQQGSHRLILDGGKFILLETESAIDLNGYVGESVQVFGALRPTVEAGGMIMRVERIELIAPKSSESSTSSESSYSSENSEEVQTSSSVSISQVTSQFSLSSLGTTSQSSDAIISSVFSSSERSEPSAAFMENLEIMARQDYETSKWTQQYCSSHVEFCIPVHRNFWFKSFGATGTNLWHVEFSAEPVENLGDGPIVLELRAGSKAELDGTVEVTDTSVTAYKEWTFGRHFVIHSDPQLEVAVRYMMESITEFTQ